MARTLFSPEPIKKKPVRAPEQPKRTKFDTPEGDVHARFNAATARRGQAAMDKMYGEWRKSPEYAERQSWSAKQKMAFLTEKRAGRAEERSRAYGRAKIAFGKRTPGQVAQRNVYAYGTDYRDELGKVGTPEDIESYDALQRKSQAEQFELKESKQDALREQKGFELGLQSTEAEEERKGQMFPSKLKTAGLIPKQVKQGMGLAERTQAEAEKASESQRRMGMLGLLPENERSPYVQQTEGEPQSQWNKDKQIIGNTGIEELFAPGVLQKIANDPFGINDVNFDMAHAMANSIQLAIEQENASPEGVKAWLETQPGWDRAVQRMQRDQSGKMDSVLEMLGKYGLVQNQENASPEMPVPTISPETPSPTTSPESFGGNFMANMRKIIG